MKIKARTIKILFGIITIVSFVLILKKLFLLFLTMLALGFPFIFVLDKRKKHNFIDVMIFSFVLSNLWLVFLFFILKFLRLNLWLIIGGLIIFPIGIFLLYFKKIKASKIYFETYDIIKVLLIFIVCSVVYTPLLQGIKIPQTDANIESYQGWVIREDSIRDGRLYEWMTDLLVGYPRFTFETFLAYFQIGIYTLFFNIKDFYLVVNGLIFLHIFFLGLAISRITKIVFRRKPYDVVSGMLALVIPLTSVFIVGGRIRPCIATALCAASILALLKQPGKYKLLFIILALTFFCHPIYGGIVAISSGLQIMIEKKITKKILLQGTLFLGGLIFWIVPFFYYKEFSTPDIINQRLSFMSWIHGLKANLGSWLWLYLIIGSIFLGKIFEKIKNKDFRNCGRFLGLLLNAFGLGLVTLFPLVGKLISLERISRISTLFMLPLIGVLGGFRNKGFKFFKSIFLVIVVIILFVSILSLHKKIPFFVSETAQNNLFPKAMDFLKKQPPGRVAVYGIYVTAVAPNIPKFSGHPEIHYGLWQGQHMNLYKKVRTQKDNRYLLPDISPTKLKKYYKAGFVKYLFVFKCDRNRPGYFVEKRIVEAFNLTPIYREPCISIFKLPFVNFVEDSRGKPKKYTRVNDELIKIFPPFDLNTKIFVHEEYFPRWKAHQKDAELEIEKSTDGYMVVIPKYMNETIILRYGFPSWEKVLTILSFLSIVLIMVF